MYTGSLLVNLVVPGQVTGYRLTQITLWRCRLNDAASNLVDCRGWTSFPCNGLDFAFGHVETQSGVNRPRGKAIKVLLERGTIVSGLYLFIHICIVLEHHYLAVSYGTRETLHINKEQGWSQKGPLPNPGNDW